jgi:proline iminopeptidase
MQRANYNLYPEIEVFDKKFLLAGDFHEVYYEICGNPTGVPVVFLHGGPGSGCNPTQRRFFDPAIYCIVLIDQRGCGRSKPQGNIEQNTTTDLVADIEAIRIALNIDKWLVFGGSWGSTLALAYATRHPNKVTGLILRGLFLSRPAEIDWFLGQVKAFFPESWDALCIHLPSNERDSPLMAYEKLVFSDNLNVSIPAAIHWNAFESSIMSLLPKPVVSNNEVDGEVELARARVQIHYIKHHCFINGSDLLTAAKEKLVHIPTQIIQGRYDMVCPPITAWELSHAMPHAEFHIIEDAGHSAMETGITSALVAATEKFKALA